MCGREGHVGTSTRPSSCPRQDRVSRALGPTATNGSGRRNSTDCCTVLAATWPSFALCRVFGRAGPQDDHWSTEGSERGLVSSPLATGDGRDRAHHGWYAPSAAARPARSGFVPWVWQSAVAALIRGCRRSARQVQGRSAIPMKSISSGLRRFADCRSATGRSPARSRVALQRADHPQLAPDLSSVRRREPRFRPMRPLMS
jgi:hypothetical protein